MSAKQTVYGIDNLLFIIHDGNHMPDAPKDRNLYSQLGNAIAKTREKRKMTQEQLAEKLSLSRTSITNIERGRQHIQLHALYQLAECLDAEIYDLLPARKSLLAAPTSKLVAVSDDEWLNRTISTEKSRHAHIPQTTDRRSGKAAEK
jgi:transcriptional regulator with XRE-family HTH domain